MHTVLRHVAVDIDLDDFDDDDLIDEIEARGYKVIPEDKEDEHPVLQEMIWRYRAGYIEDAMLLLERKFPEMHGISKLIRKEN